MKKLALAITISGMLLLLFLLHQKPKEINDSSQLEKLEINTKVAFQSEIVSERSLSPNKKIMKMEKGIELVCEGCEETFESARIRIEGLVSDFNGKKQVEVLRIECLKDC